MGTSIKQPEGEGQINVAQFVGDSKAETLQDLSNWIKEHPDMTFGPVLRWVTHGTKVYLVYDWWYQ